MKTLLLGLFLIPALCFGQKKLDTKIIVTVSDTTNLLNRIAAELYDRGYSLEEKDNAVGFLLTKEKYERKVVGSRKIKALIKDNTITFTGLCRVELSTLEREKGRFDPVQYRGMKGSLFMVAWEEMEDVAKKFGSQITYSK